MPANDPLISLQNVSRIFRSGEEQVRVLDGVTLSVRQGEMIAIVGPSGSGKSTLMNLLGGLDIPDSGEICIAGIDTTRASHEHLAALRSSHIGFIFQRYHLMPYLTAAENVAVPAQYTAMRENVQRQRAAYLLAHLGLEDRMSHKPSQLSGGQQQRVSIARALMNGASVILADEPTGALDAQSGQEMMAILHGLHQSGHTIILVTHDRDVASQAERIIEISDGKITADLPNRHVQPASGPVVLLPAANTGRSSWRESFHDAVKMAWRALNGHRIRALLSMLGIIIGVASVITSMAVGEGAKQKIIRDISALGTSTLSIHPGLGWDNPRPDFGNALSDEDVRLLSELPYVANISPVFNRIMEAQVEGRQMFINITGVNARYFAVRDLSLEAGRKFNEHDVETREPVLLVDAATANTLFHNDKNPTGKSLYFNNVPFRLVGITASKGLKIAGGGLNAWMAYTALQERLTGSMPVAAIEVQVAKGMSLKEAQRHIEYVLDKAHGRRDFFIETDSMMLETIQKTSDSLTLLIAAIAGISLIVGGVGVMNIMLVSVAERTHEIGIRLAVGARAADIMRQFLIESMVVCLFGCAIGVVVTFVAGTFFSLLTTQFEMVFTPLPILYSCGFSALIGLGFGYFPARFAARMKPTEALARE
ncbi:ATP-binding cassette domain-containing protein [Rahnella sp. C60]|uniref:ABC transporter permease n=1 Tax=Rahnella perminowiae TaxID=2816244 RepID=UPI001C26F3FD|nr:ABC transporter permease [Rahnella perminowiae]MBU9809737.1 ATP-binding cassette domain-containing protein [Rahnella perminowiae]MBU9817419.1 ATP-binding cassette domain-containing protein [Rahnella perminowiae]MCX2941608.1 ATP-binding cassette domain-containing protein [Rahnella perminowiae]